MKFQPLMNTFWLNSMHHGVDIVNHLLLNMLKPLKFLKLIHLLFLQLKLMPLNTKNQDQDLEFKDSQLLNGLSMDNLLTILEVELNQLLLIGLKKRFPQLPLNYPLLMPLKNNPKLTKFWEFISEIMLNPPIIKLIQMSPKLSMMSFLLTLSHLMLLLIMEQLPTLLFYSDNLMNLELLSLENSQQLLFLNGSLTTLYQPLWISIKPQLKEFLEITSQHFSY